MQKTYLCRMRKWFLSILFVSAFFATAFTQTTFIVRYTETTGGLKYINIGDIRVVYPRGTGGQMIQGSSLTSVPTQENVAYFLGASCGNLMEFEEYYATSGSNFTHRTVALNPERIASLQRNANGKAIVRYVDPVISLVSWEPFDTVLADLTRCNSVVFSGDLVGTGAISATNGANSVLGTGVELSIIQDSLSLDSIGGCLSPRKICQDSASVGDVLKWDGVKWSPGAVSSGTCSDTLRYFANDSIAALGGVNAGQLYLLSSNNYYGGPHGSVRVLS